MGRDTSEKLKLSITMDRYENMNKQEKGKGRKWQSGT